MFLNKTQADIDSTLESLAESLDFFYENTSRLYPCVRETLTPSFEQRRERVLNLHQLSREHLKLLPRRLDVEKDDYRWLWSRLKGVVSGSEKIILRGILERERNVLTALAKAMTHPLPNAIDHQLYTLFEQSHNVLQELYAARYSLGQDNQKSIKR